MKKTLLFVALTAVMGLATSCNSNSKSTTTEQQETTEQTAVTTIDEVIAQGEALVDQTVTVEGVVDAICPCEKSEGKVACLKAGDQHLAVKNAEPWDATIVGQTISVTGVVKKCECPQEGEQVAEGANADEAKKCEQAKKDEEKKCAEGEKKEGEKKCCEKEGEKKCCDGEKKCDAPKIYVEVTEYAVVANTDNATDATDNATETPAETPAQEAK